MVIPIWSVAGQVVTHYLRPDAPRTVDGKILKYELPSKSPVCLDVPPSMSSPLFHDGRWRSQLQDPKVCLFVTEGPLKADSAVSHGICCIALLGVWMWKQPLPLAGGWKQPPPLPDWGEIPLKNRDVDIVFDSDIKTNPNVYKAARRLGAFLVGRQAQVRYVYLPPADNGGKTGLDDFLAGGHTADDLIALARPELEALEQALPEQHLRPKIVCMAEVKALAVEWLWPGYVPRGLLTMLEGDPGVGKSQLALFVVAAVSIGGELPGHSRVQPGTSLICTAEDSLAHVVRQRLDALGADPTRIHAVEGVVTASGDESPLVLTPDGLTVLDRAIIEYQPDLVLVDPIVLYLGADVDMHRANQVRAVLGPLASMAGRHGCAMWINRHLNKSGGTNPIYRGQGSVDFAAAARSILLMVEDSADSTRRIVAQTKCSVGPLAQSLAFRFGSDGVLGYVEPVDVTASELLESANHEGSSRSKVEAAVDFLTDALSNGPRLASDVEEEANAAGIKSRTLRRARTHASVEVTQTRSDDGVRIESWTWSLPLSRVP